MSAALIEFKRLSNRLGDFGLVPFLEEAQRQGIGGPPFRLDPNLAKDVLDIYRESNRRVAREFLGRTNGELFDEDDLERGTSSGADFTGALPVDSLAMLLALYIKTNNEELKRLGAELQAAQRVAAEAIAAVTGETAVNADVRTIRESGFFDEASYALAAEASAAGMDPVLHCIAIGEARGVSPSAKFDPIFYGARYPDVAVAKVNRLLHYLRDGRGEGRQPLPETRTRG